MTNKTIKKLLLSEDPDHQSIIKWLQDEASFWAELRPHLNNNNGLYNIEPIISYHSLLTKQIEKLSKNPNTLDNLLTNEIVAFGRVHHIPNHDHPIADDLIRLRYDLSRLEQTLLNYKTCASIVDSFFEDEYNTKYKNLIESQRINFESQQQKWGERTKDFLDSATKIEHAITEHYESLKSSAIDELDKASKDKENHLAGISARIEKDITSSEPVSFWEQKRSTHAETAKAFRITAIVLGILACSILFCLVLAAFKDPDTTDLFGYKVPNHFYIATCLLIGSAFVWALRISIQLMMTNMALEAEAFEKSTAIKTYVALSSQNIDSDIEKDFHRALLTFNKIKITDETNAPEVIRILEGLLNNKKSS